MNVVTPPSRFSSEQSHPCCPSTSCTKVRPTPWPPSFVEKNGVNRLSRASGESPGPESSTNTAGDPSPRPGRTLTQPPCPAASMAFFTMFTITCPNCARSTLTTGPCGVLVDGDIDRSGVGLRAQEDGGLTREVAEIDRLAARRRQAIHLGEPGEERPELLGARAHDADGLLEVAPVGGWQVRRVGQARGQQRRGGADGVVDLVRQHANELLVRGALHLAHLVGQFLGEHEPAREPAVDEGARHHAHAPSRRARKHPRLARRHPREGLVQPSRDGRQVLAHHGGAEAEHAVGRGIQVRNPAVEVEDDDGGRRRVDDLGEEVLLLARADPFGAELIDHRVVEVDEAVDPGLAHGTHARHHVARSEQHRALVDEAHGREDVGQELEAHGERREQDEFGQQPRPRLAQAQHAPRGDAGGDMRDREVHGEADATAHTAISCFSSRR